MENSYLVTGAHGFLGRYITKALQEKGEVYTLGRGKNNDIVCDLSRQEAHLQSKYTAIIHVAGKAHSIPKTEEEEEAFFQVNYEGTKRLVKNLNTNQIPSYFVFISTVAVYGIDEGENISEDTVPCPSTAYGKSKREAELYLQQWAESNNVQLQILRLPLLVGKEPPGNLKSMIDGICNGKFATIGGGKAKRSMVFAEDVATFIANHMNVDGFYNLTDGEHPNFNAMAHAIKSCYKGKGIKNIPIVVAKTLALAGDIFEKVTGKSFPITSNRLSKMTSSLTFSDSKARSKGYVSHAIVQNFNQFMQ